MMTRLRILPRLAVAAVPLCATLVLPTPSAIATHQYCGAAAEGVHLGGYTSGTRDNGHPTEPHEDGTFDEGVDFAGAGSVEIAKNVAMAAERLKETIAISSTMYDTLGFRSPIKEVKLGFTIAGLAAGIVSTTADAVVLAFEQRNAEVNACGGTMLGDMIDTLMVAYMQEELAGLDPASGGFSNPSSMFVLPDDGSPEWTSESDLYPGHKDTLPIPYIDGLIDDESIGVALVVRNAIAHLEAHGIKTGGGYRWVNGVGLVYQDGAKDLWWDGIRLLEDGRVRLAYAKFSEAYRMAVSTETSN